ncbi:hypothetical protein SAMN05216511_3829 [Streptomyces sp. KS_16]|nr:hypothetical protein BX261_3372 [Streptomyces sp. 2321.6]SDR42483.1 hypothetical protein SAMN05216511_3829 [Streptomyces sp. KS_16]SNC69505.1 hypothetical protein SAMN06272741_3366 [Streptomyces sp. 2114.4]
MLSELRRLKQLTKEPLGWESRKRQECRTKDSESCALKIRYSITCSWRHEMQGNVAKTSGCRIYPQSHRRLGPE